MSKTKSVCEECSKVMNYTSGCWKWGHWLCHRCKNKRSLPQLFDKVYSFDEPKKEKYKKAIKGLRLTFAESKILYGKHFRAGMSHSQIKYRLQQVRQRIKYSHEKEKLAIAAEKAKPTYFKEEFEKIVGGKK